MEERLARKEIIEGGIQLREKGLVARTWGNASARMDGGKMVITPSGLDYKSMKEEDLVIVDLETREAEGIHRPSGEKGIHIEAYQLFDDVNYAVHTHQSYATVVGLTSMDDFDITEEELEQLGGLGVAAYAIPGSKEITQNVRGALEAGAKTVLMLRHGALICGKDREDVNNKALLLEEICNRNTKGQPLNEDVNPEVLKEGAEILAQVREVYPNADLANSAAALKAVAKGEKIRAQIDDMAQMVGVGAPVAMSEKKLMKLLKRHDAVAMPGIGIFVKSDNPEDLEALKILAEKSSIARNHTNACGVKANIGAFESEVQHLYFKFNYSKRKDKK